MAWIYLAESVILTVRHGAGIPRQGKCESSKEKWKEMLLDDNVHYREGNIIFI